MIRRTLATALLAAFAATVTTTTYAADVKIGASLLTQQHPFYVELANAMKAEAAKDHAQLDIAIANQDLSKQIADVQDFVTKKVDVIVLSAGRFEGRESGRVDGRARRHSRDHRRHQRGWRGSRLAHCNR